MTDLPQPPTSPAPMKRSLRWLLILSLALNLLVAGVVIGRIVAGPMMGRPTSVELVLGPFARALAPEDRRAIARDVIGRTDMGDMRRSERQADFARLAAALRAEPFDREGVATIMTELRDKARGVETAVEAAVLDRLSAMSPADRAAFADRLEAGIGHGGED